MPHQFSDASPSCGSCRVVACVDLGGPVVQQEEELTVCDAI